MLVANFIPPINQNKLNNMKTTRIISLVGLFSIISCSIFGQENEMIKNEVQIDSTQTIYCNIVGIRGVSKLKVTIDMGEYKGILGLNSSQIVDGESGNKKKFNSMIDALNYMSTKGWEFCQVYTTIVTGTTSATIYLVKLVVKAGSDGNYYPVTKKLLPIIENTVK